MTIATVDGDFGGLSYSLLLILLRIWLKNPEVVIEDLFITVVVCDGFDEICALTAVSHVRCFPNGR